MSRINNEQQEGEKSYPFARWMSWLFLTASALLLVLYLLSIRDCVLWGERGLLQVLSDCIDRDSFLGGCASVARRDSSQYSNGRLLSGGWTLPG